MCFHSHDARAAGMHIVLRRACGRSVVAQPVVLAPAARSGSDFDVCLCPCVSSSCDDNRWTFSSSWPCASAKEIRRRSERLTASNVPGSEAYMVMFLKWQNYAVSIRGVKTFGASVGRTFEIGVCDKFLGQKLHSTYASAKGI